MKDFLIKIKKHFVLYALVITLAFCGSFYLVDFINKPRNEQTFCFFLCSYTTDIKPLHSAMLEQKPSYLREIEMRSYSPNNEYYDTYFSVVGCISSDIALIPESKIKDDIINENFIAYNDFVLNKYFADAEFYKINEGKYGVLVHKKGQKHPTDYIRYYDTETNDQNYYAFVRKGSLHAGGVSNTNFYTSYTYINYLRTI